MPWKPEVDVIPNSELQSPLDDSVTDKTPAEEHKEATANIDVEEDEDFNLLADLVGF